MKNSLVKRSILSFLLLAMLSTTSFARSDWEKVATSYNYNLKSVAISYSSGFWAVGDEGAIVNGNGAINTGIADISNYNLNCITIGDNKIYIVGEKRAEPNKYQGIIIKSTDAGVSWSQVFNLPLLSVNTSYKSVSTSSDGENVYISGSNGVILFTSDYGKNWARLLTPKLPNLTYSADAEFITWHKIKCDPSNSNNVWMLAKDFSVAAKSTDGGGTWAVFDLPVDKTYGFLEETRDYSADYPPQLPLLSFANTSNKYYIGTSEGKYLYSTDFSNWSLNATNQPVETKFNGVACDPWDGYTVLLGNGGNLLNVTESAYGPQSKYDPGIVFNDAILDYLGYAVGSNGSVWSNNTLMGIDKYLYAGPINDLGMYLEVRWGVAGLAPGEVIDPNDYVSIYRSVNDGPMRFIARVKTNIKLYLSMLDNYQGLYKYYLISDKYGEANASKDKTTWSTTPLSEPSYFNVSDVPDDQGGKLNLNWASTNPVVVGRGTSPNGPFWRISGENTGSYLDETSELGRKFYYCIQCTSGSNFSPIVLAQNISSIDNIRPNTLPAPNYAYDASNHIISLSWPESDEPNLAGYWVCPVINDEAFKFDAPVYYHLSHTAPLDRTVFSWRVPDYVWQNNLTCSFAVTAMDYSENIGHWSPYTYINTKAKTNSSVVNATAYNNGKHLIYDDKGRLFLVYSSGDSVLYQQSWDDGYTWTPTSGFVSGGLNPIPVVGYYGEDTTVLWKAETENVGWVLKSAKRSGNGWLPEETILAQAGGYDQMHTVTPPSMVMDKNGIHVAIERNDAIYHNGAYPILWNWQLVYGFKPYGGAFTWQTLESDSGVINPPVDPRCPSIAVDSKGAIHIAWNRNGEIYWKMHNPYTASWQEKVNISNSPDVESSEPSVSIYGGLHVVWQEGNDIWHKQGTWGITREALAIDYVPNMFYWSASENASNTSSASCDPVFAGNYIAWSEETAPGIYSAFYSNYVDYSWQSSVNYSKNPSQPAGYPQIAYRQNVDGNKMTTIWTEGTGPLYSLIARDEAGQVTAQAAADVGGEEASIYLIERDGYIVYGASDAIASTGIITVDYDSTALEYYLPTLDRDQKQTMKFTFYQEYADKADYIYQVWVDDVSLGSVKVPSGQSVVFEKDLPNSVTHDGEGIVKIVNLKSGKIVTCDKWELYAYDKATGRGGTKKSGGVQIASSDSKPLAYVYAMTQNAPNPFNGQTRISYQLAKPGNVSLKIYNTLGQLVNTLVEGHQQPGIYSASWNGKDNSGRTAANGVYIYRLESGDFKATKKMVVIK